MYFMAACPLSKIFVKKYQKHLISHPEEITKETINGKKWTMTIPRSSGAIELEYGKIYNINDFVESRREKPDNVLQWLCDESLNAETNCYGVVTLDVERTLMTDVTAILEGKKSGQDQGVKTKLASARKEATKRAHEKVMTDIKRVYNHYMKQQQMNKENGVGGYEPSMTEYLCMYALKEEIAKSRDESKQMREIFLQNMQEVVGANNHV